MGTRFIKISKARLEASGCRLAVLAEEKRDSDQYILIQGAKKTCMAKAIVVICDGLGDLPVDGRTPLQAAKTPHMDLLAKNGVCGQYIP